MSTLGCWFTLARRTQSRSLTWTAICMLIPRAGAMPVLRCDVGLTLSVCRFARYDVGTSKL